MDLAIAPFDPYAETVKTVIYALLLTSYLGLAVGLPLIIIEPLKERFLKWSIASNIIGVVLASQWLILVLMVFVACAVGVLAIYHHEILALGWAAYMLVMVTAPSACTLLCWHHLLERCGANEATQ